MKARESKARSTKQREAEKRRLKAGHKPTKQLKVVQDHYDDLGDDMSGIIPSSSESCREAYQCVPADYCPSDCSTFSATLDQPDAMETYMANMEDRVHLQGQGPLAVHITGNGKDHTIVNCTN